MRRMLAAFAILLGLSALAPANAQNRFYVVNSSGIQIDEIYVSSSRVQQWGPDVLGDSVLPAGNQVYITPSFTDCVLPELIFQVGWVPLVPYATFVQRRAESAPSKVCPKCGTTYAGNVKFCGKDGTTL